MNELPDWRESFPPALLPPAMQDRSTPPPRVSNIPSVKIGNNKDELFRSSINRTSNLSIPFLNTDPPTEEDDVGSRTSIGKVVKKPPYFRMQDNVNKALPQTLRANCRSRQNHSSHQSYLATPITESIQMLPVSRIVLRRSPTQELDAMATIPQGSPTYATIFDIEAYKDI